MRSFVLDGPFSLNGYAEVPENSPKDYMDEVYDDLDVWGGLTFSGYGIVRYGSLSLFTITNRCGKTINLKCQRKALRQKVAYMPMVTRLLKLLDLTIATLILVPDQLNMKLKD